MNFKFLGDGSIDFQEIGNVGIIVDTCVRIPDIETDGTKVEMKIGSCRKIPQLSSVDGQMLLVLPLSGRC